MSIWKVYPSLEELNAMNRGTMIDFLGIAFVEIGSESLTATMPVDERTKQPFGLMHGGASAALAETVGSVGANFCVDHRTSYCVGLDIAVSHIKSVREGEVTGIGRPLHIGRTTQLWEIEIYSDKKELVSKSRLTMLVLQRSL